MNPYLEYSQRIPGQCDGRCIGIIDTHRFVPLVELLPLLRETGAGEADQPLAMPIGGAFSPMPTRRG